MNAQDVSIAQPENEGLSLWLSTYALMTAERLLEHYKIKYIHLSHYDLIRALHNPDSLFYRVLQIPFKEVFNGIILQHAKDYQAYVNKTLVDYLLSGEQSRADT